MLFNYLVIYLCVVLSLGVFSYEMIRGRGPFEVIHLVFAFGCLWEDCYGFFLSW